MIYDLIYQGLSEGQYSVIDSQAVELHRRALYADRFADEGIMYDYVEKAKIGNVTGDKEVKKYIGRLYGIANQGWGKAKGQYTFGSFLEDTGRMAEELRKRKLQEETEKSRREVCGRQEAEQRAEQEAQARQSAEQKAQQEAQKAQQEAQRAEQLKQALEQKDLERKVMKSCVKKLAKFDEELQSAIDEESEGKIVKAAIDCRVRSPEEVIDAIIKEIEVNREKIIKEGRVSDEIIEASVRSFSNQGTSLSDIDVSQGISVGMGKDSRAGFS